MSYKVLKEANYNIRLTGVEAASEIMQIRVQGSREKQSTSIIRFTASFALFGPLPAGACIEGYDSGDSPEWRLFSYRGCEARVRPGEISEINGKMGFERFDLLVRGQFGWNCQTGGKFSCSVPSLSAKIGLMEANAQYDAKNVIKEVYNAGEDYNDLFSTVGGQDMSGAFPPADPPIPAPAVTPKKK